MTYQQQMQRTLEGLQRLKAKGYSPESLLEVMNRERTDLLRNAPWIQATMMSDVTGFRTEREFLLEVANGTLLGGRYITPRKRDGRIALIARVTDQRANPRAPDDSFVVKAYQFGEAHNLGQVGIPTDNYDMHLRAMDLDGKLVIWREPKNSLIRMTSEFERIFRGENVMSLEYKA